MTSEVRWFPAPWDWTAKVVSGVVLTVMVALSVVVHSLPIGIALLLVLVLTYGYSPRGYLVSKEAIVVKRLFRDAVIPLTAGGEARPATAGDFAGAIRLWGSGGLFGYFGLFRTRGLGKSTWYVTDRSRVVVVITPGKTALFSPDDPAGFVSSLSLGPPLSGASYVPPDPAWHSSNAGLWVGGAIAIAVITLVTLALSYSPGAPEYQLSGGTLAIRDRFYPVTVKADAVDVGQIRVVAIDAGSEWRPTTRTNGFSNAHYHSGWYLAANGRRARMYWADSRRLVLLPPKAGGDPVLLQVNEPDEFADRLKREWGR